MQMGVVVWLVRSRIFLFSVSFPSSSSSSSSYLKEGNGHHLLLLLAGEDRDLTHGVAVEDYATEDAERHNNVPGHEE